MRITAIAFELAKVDSDKTMTVSHRLMSSKFAYDIHIPTFDKGFVLPFPSNILVSTIKQEPAVMIKNLRIVCDQLGVKLTKCITFTFDTEESEGISANAY